jgi:type III restriction enzyme
MENEFFSKPILNSPYGYPSRHWELDNKGQPTQEIIEHRRRAEFITPIPKPKKRKESGEQLQLFDFEEDDPISSADQRYDPTPIINELRKNVDDWRKLSNPNDWLVTPETVRLLEHWRHHSLLWR